MGKQSELTDIEINAQQMGVDLMREYLKENKAYHLSFLVAVIIGFIVAKIFTEVAAEGLLLWVLGFFFVAELVKFIVWRIEQREE